MLSGISSSSSCTDMYCSVCFVVLGGSCFSYFTQWCVRTVAGTGDTFFLQGKLCGCLWYWLVLSWMSGWIFLAQRRNNYKNSIFAFVRGRCFKVNIKNIVLMLLPNRSCSELRRCSFSWPNLLVLFMSPWKNFCETEWNFGLLKWWFGKDHSDVFSLLLMKV